MTRDDLVKQVQLQKLAEKMLADKVAVTDDEINQYIKDNSELLPKDTPEEEMKTFINNQLKQQKLSSEIQTWLNDLRSKANINYFTKY